jgi:probable phosphoglycerate mutase
MTVTTLIIARHGNTFEAHETLRRVGARTDLPLTDKGRDQARAVGRYLHDHDLTPDVVYTSHLKRTIETAALAVPNVSSHPLEIFNEIDYGDDENKIDEEVIARIGAQALKDWDEHAKVPQGWNADPLKIIADLKNFAAGIVANLTGQKILVVTSNGIARFFPHITGNFNGFKTAHSLKIATGALCVLEHDGGEWAIKLWNEKP